MFNLTFTQLFSYMVFVSVGFVCFKYGKRQASWKPMAAGLALMALPYLIHQPVTLWVGGALILGSMYVFRD